MDTRKEMPHCNLARKAMAIPLSVALAAGCTPLPAFADGASADAGLKTASVLAAGPSVAAQVSSQSRLYSIYFPVLLRAANGLGEFEDIHGSVRAEDWSPTYFLFDLGDDGTPELMIRMTTYTGSSVVYVYTAKSGEAVSLGSYMELNGKSAGNAKGNLYVGGWNNGKSYVNEIVLSNGAVTPKYVTSGEASDENPNGEVRVVTDFLDEREASWLSGTAIGDYSTLDSKAKFALAKGSVAVGAAGAYTGAAKTPDVTVELWGETLEEGVDYRLEYSDNVNAGTGTVTAIGINDYQGTLSSQFAIAKADISTAAMSVASAGAYTGAAKTPAVTVRDGDATLVNGASYQVSYANNVNAGTGTAIVTGQGNYQGTKKIPFAIARADIASASATAASGGVYTGAAKAPAVTVRYGNTTLAKDANYQVSYANNVNAGTGTAIITGQGNYQGTKRVSFTISKANISWANASVASAGSYTGSAKKPEVTVRFGSSKLVQKKSFNVSYKNNKNAGTATAVITGTGNFQGTKNVSFKIAKASNTMSVKASAKTVSASAVSKAAQKISIVSLSKKAAGKVTYKNASSASVSKVCSVNSSTGAITVKKGAPKGTYTVKVLVSAAGDSNHSSASKTVSAKVTVR